MTPDFQAALARVEAAMEEYRTTRTVKALLVLEAELAELRRAHAPVAERSAERWRRTRGVT